jgi:predicted O-methyltransferase YrrM
LGDKDFVRFEPCSQANFKKSDSMNNILSEMLETGVTTTASGNSTVKLHSSISASEGQFLQRLVRQVDPTVSLEVGLAYGISALFICDALNAREGTQHIAIDPNQGGAIDPNQHYTSLGDSWGGIGIANLRRAGYGDIVRLIEAPSYRALAELESSGQRIDFAFIDGWHTFDFALVDFFFIDRMLNVGGVVTFDDASWPAIRKVCRFVRTNLAYSVLGVDGSDSEPSQKRPLSERLLRRSPFRRLLRPETIAPDRSMGLEGRCIAFRKQSEDSRIWNHFVDF